MPPADLSPMNSTEGELHLEPADDAHESFDDQTPPRPLPARPSEARLIEVAGELPGNRVLSTTVGRAQAAEQAASQRSGAKVTCWLLDSYQAAAVRQYLGDQSPVQVCCQADCPQAEVELGFVPLTSNGEVELARDQLQNVYHQLEMGGRLVASVDNPRDQWLHDQLKMLDRSVKVHRFDDATVYWIQKRQPLKRLKDFSCELAFRDHERLLHLQTRPGVFSHRRLDNGARQLLDAVDVFPEARILDIGCGSGAVALGLAARDSTAQIYAIDSHTRAVACTEWGARKNGLSNVGVELSHDGELAFGQPFDMALANPPYYADFRIAHRMIEIACRHLRPGGRLVLVTKQPSWYSEQLPKWLEEVDVFPSRRYHIASGVTPSRRQAGPAI
jgi:16S rRNA (guanine1207-N2)-methyltransferase